MPQLTYAIDAERLGPYEDRFVVLDADADTDTFVEVESARRQGAVKWVARGLLRAAVGGFSANALLDTYPLFMLSTAQWRQLLAPHARGRLLDVGAAAGDVTLRLAPLFDDVTATDVSRPMVRRLRERGVRAAVVDLAQTRPAGAPFDTVALLNVLDRCARPHTLLGSAIASLVPGGTLVVSMPLPYHPCWYDGPRLSDPLERLPVRERRWEAAAVELARYLEHLGGRVLAVTRAPYLSGGDRHEPLYVLDAVILVLAYK